MIEDPIIKELHQVREEIAARHHFDVSEIFDHFRKREAKEKRTVISSSPKTENASCVTKPSIKTSSPTVEKSRRKPSNPKRPVRFLYLRWSNIARYEKTLLRNVVPTMFSANS